MDGKVVIISAPSGAGKTTIVRHLLACGLGLEFSVSAATRQKRENETDGVDYFFMSADEFRKMITNGELAEWQEVYKDSFYGTPKKEIERIWSAGKTVLFDVDVMGGINLKKMFGKEAVNKGKHRSKETIKRIKANTRLAMQRPEVKQKQKENKSPMFGEKNGMYKKHHSKKSKEKISNTLKNTPKIECQYCKKSFYPWHYSRSHGDKCKHK